MTFDPMERTTPAELLATAQDLVAFLEYMATASALPGDEAVAWRDRHEEAIEATRWLANGLALIEAPE